MKNHFRVGDWLVQPKRNLISSSNKTVQLEPKTMDLLVCLAEHSQDVVSKERLIQAVWPDVLVSDEVLTSTIWKLRNAFEDDPEDPWFIQTIPRRGYQLIARVRFQDSESTIPGFSWWRS